RDIGYELGLVDQKTYEAFQVKREAIEKTISHLEATTVKPGQEVNELLTGLGSVPLRQPATLSDLMRRPELTFDDLKDLIGIESGISDDVSHEVQVQVKYKGYIERQMEQVERFKRIESVDLPEEIDYAEFSGLSNEVVEKLTRIRPKSLGQASRISGITPAAISVLQVHLKKIGLL
ncbi:MAG: tRNA uridine-5-carboxymethylaminomethyl(34) synthesis enzyme MnmG, partial [Desulfobulbaceae bacterium]|nr:tRNA uridine-5-carboxymethylaminomethyl(34) synthesis enzyme MnmG [Desulfobulbaceae bacterium]